MQPPEQHIYMYDKMIYSVMHDTVVQCSLYMSLRCIATHALISIEEGRNIPVMGGDHVKTISYDNNYYETSVQYYAVTRVSISVACTCAIYDDVLLANNQR